MTAYRERMNAGDYDPPKPKQKKPTSKTSTSKKTTQTKGKP